jgi:hypothetical protein
VLVEFVACVCVVGHAARCGSSDRVQLRTDGSSGEASVNDRGISADVIDLGSYKSTDFVRRPENSRCDLLLAGDGARDIYIH